MVCVFMPDIPLKSEIPAITAELYDQYDTILKLVFSDWLRIRNQLVLVGFGFFSPPPAAGDTPDPAAPWHGISNAWHY